MIRLYRVCTVLCAVVMLATGVAPAQYWGERAQQKGFEGSEFSFVPANLVPYGLGAFAGTTPGVLRDPLLDLVLNPAHLRLDSLQNDVLIYTDFRASRNTKSTEAYIMPTYQTMDYATSSFARPYPVTYLNTRKVLEPVFSAAVIGRPFRDLAPDLLVGGTYQLMLQDEKYYDVPSDIYRSVLGADYTGRTAAATASGMSIIDRSSGDDNMHQEGHFIALFAQDRPLPILDVGVKVGRVLHTRKGAYGSTNLWDALYATQYTSLWSNRELRDQGYQHTEVSGGALLHITEATTLGVSGGYLWGTATQALTRNDSSAYLYSSGTSSGSRYVSAGKTLSEWSNDGTATEFGIELRSQLSSRNTMTLFYRPRWSTIAIGTASFINDTSDSFYSWMNNGAEVVSRSRSLLRDIRSGRGEDKSRTDLFLATFTWDVDPNVTLSLGAQLELFTRTVNTTEGVDVHGVSASSSTYPSYPYEYFHENIESKDLEWAFSAKRRSFRIPVFVTIRASRVAGILLGLSRDISRWEIDDVTLALFRRRSVVENAVVTDKYNFGERYTQPTETRTDVTTSFMAGLTVAPSPVFQARVLVVPVFADRFDGQELDQLQWWLGLTVTP